MRGVAATIVGPRAILLIATGLVLLPMLADLAASGRTAPFRYFASDSFYYHTVARNIAERGAISFDGTLPTNGFHPLWQALLAALYAASLWLPWSEAGYLMSAAVASALLVSASVWILGRAIIRGGGRLSLWFVLLPVGAYGIVLLPYWLWAVDVAGLVYWSQGKKPLYGTLWSYANGMESGLVLVAYACLASVFVRRADAPRRGAALVGLLAAVLALARLDHALLAACFPAFYLRRARRHAFDCGWGEAVICVICFALPLGVYLAANAMYAGVMLPVSGVAKSTFPFPTLENVGSVLSAARAPLTVASVSRVYRAAQLVIPMTVATWVLWSAARGARAGHEARPGTSEYAAFLHLTAVGVLLLGAYDFFFVRTFAAGHWYVPVSVVFVSLAVFAPASRSVSLARATLGRTVVLGACVLAVFVAAHRRPDAHWLYADFYFNEAPAIRAFYGDQPPRVLEYDDGIIAFATRFPSMSALSPMLDAEAARAMKAGRFHELALARGFDRAATLVYFVPDSVERGARRDLGTDVAGQRVAIFDRAHPELRVEPEYISPSGNVWFARLAPVGAPTAGPGGGTTDR